MDKAEKRLSILWKDLQNGILALAWLMELKPSPETGESLKAAEGIIRTLSVRPLALLSLRLDGEAKVTLLPVTGKKQARKTPLSPESLTALRDSADYEATPLLPVVVLNDIFPQRNNEKVEVRLVALSEITMMKRKQRFMLWQSAPKDLVDRWASLSMLQLLLPQIVIAMSRIIVSLPISSSTYDELAIICRSLARSLQPLLLSHLDKSIVSFGKRLPDSRDEAPLWMKSNGTLEISASKGDSQKTITALRLMVCLNEWQGWLACFARWVASPRDDSQTNLLIDCDGKLLALRIGRQRCERKLPLIASAGTSPPMSLAALQGLEHIAVAFAAYHAVSQRNEMVRTAAHQIEPLFADTGVSPCAYSMTLFEEKAAGPTLFSRKNKAETGMRVGASRTKVTAQRSRFDLQSQCTIELEMQEKPSSPCISEIKSIRTPQPQRSYLTIAPSQQRFEDYLQERLFEAADTPLMRQSVMQTYVKEFVPEEAFLGSASTITLGEIPEMSATEEAFNAEYDRYATIVEEERERFITLASDWNFNALALSDTEQVAFCLHLLRPHLSLLKATDNELFFIITQLQEQYRPDNPYHNFSHAVSVLHATHFLLGSNYLADLSTLERAGMLLAALGHDVGHRGCSNHFEMHSRSELALIYNDISPLENHHASTLFRVLNDPAVGFMAGLGSDYWKMRNFIVEAVLATDMKLHFKLLEQQDSLEGRTPDKKLRSCLALHAADVSASSKSTDTALAWSRLVNQEFYQQYLREGEVGLKQTANFRNLNLRSEQLLGEITFVKVILLPFYRSIHLVDQQNYIAAETTEETSSEVLLPTIGLADAIRNCEFNLTVYPAMHAEALEAEKRNC